LSSVKDAGNEVKSDGWISRRYLLKKDNLGFSFHETIIEKGAILEMEYKNHLEAVYCIKGHGTITDLNKNKTWLIEPGTMYALNKHDKHRLEGISEMVMMCVFNPPVTGQEVHKKDGSYPLIED
jgi:L-ectoine synthase